MKTAILAKTTQNLVTYSEQFDHSDWPEIAITINPNATLSPDGNLTADKIVEEAVNFNHHTYQELTGIALGKYATSVYIKAGERNKVRLDLWNFADLTLATATFNLIGSGSIYNETTPGIASIGYIGNGWYRLYMAADNAITDTEISVRIYLIDQYGQFVYFGDPGKGLYVWGISVFQADEGILLPYDKTEGTALTNSPEYIELGLEYDITYLDKNIEYKYRSSQGTEERYKLGDLDSISFSTKFISFNDMQELNTYWFDNEDLIFSTRTVPYGIDINVHIVNKEKPIGEFMEFNVDNYKGHLILESF